MEQWSRENLDRLAQATSADEVFEAALHASRALGFEYCAYGARLPVPLSRQRTFARNNYPEGWQHRYVEAGYLAQDPTVLHGLAHGTPVTWNDAVFEKAPVLWEEAQSFGLKVGWAQSLFGQQGTRGMLTLARSGEQIQPAELDAKEASMSCLANATHQAFSRVLAADLAGLPEQPLTPRQVDILKWSADGKTSSEIAEILGISINTVNFHVKNALVQLNAPNKMAAVVRAAMLGLLN